MVAQNRGVNGMAKGKSQGIRSRNNREVPVRTGAPRKHIQKAGVAQLGQMQGDHATGKGGSTGYTGVSLIGPKQPISVKLGNEVSATTVCGPGGSREILRSGGQGTHGATNPGQPMKPSRPLWEGWEK
jgi:hypothetical protein